MSTLPHSSGKVDISQMWSGSRAVLLIGIAILVVPVVLANYRQSWATEQGEQGPVVLALGIWLLVRSWPHILRSSRPPATLGVVVAMIGGSLIYLVGRISEQFTLASYGFYALGMGLLYGFHGGRSLRAAWFPLVYLAAALPVPYTVNVLLTSHLRLLVTAAAVTISRAAGLLVAHDGLNILMDHYVLAVQDACSGMNSLFSLTAIGLLYLYLRRNAPWSYIAALAGPVVALAISGNIVRILLLIGLTHYFGDAVAQGFLHEGAGLATFAATFLLLLGLDAIAWPLFVRLRGLQA